MCVFCEVDPLYENETAIIILDKYPVSYGHMLVIPKRHVESYFELSDLEQRDVSELVKIARNLLYDLGAGGFNVGINDGAVAGQTIMHAHIHVIPRNKGDMADPSGGVRGVIPEKQKY